MGDYFLRKTSIIIVTYNNFLYNKDCLESIRKYTRKDTYEIIVVDNNSKDGTREYLSEQKDVILLANQENLGFVKACNQGFLLANKENDILFLNNDTIVTYNWLLNMKTALYSNSKVGAVGAVSNNDENLQGSNLKYHNMEEMQEQAYLNNISDSKRWEEKNFLIGYCLLVRREVMDLVQGLDEKYSPGYIDDNDFSCQIKSLGYQLLLCHDAFIHHYLGVAFRKDWDKFYKILNKNRAYFKKKWGFNTFCFDEIKSASMPLIMHPKKILELDAGIGCNMLKLKYNFSGVEVYGVESNKVKRNFASQNLVVYRSLDDVKDNDFDYILIGNVLEKKENSRELLKKLKKHLNVGGYIIGEIHNVSFINNIKDLLNNQSFRGQGNIKKWWGISDVLNLFRSLGFTNEFIYSWYTSGFDSDKYYNTLKELTKKDYNISYYSFRFQK